MALRSSQSVALHREQIRLMQELEEQALREESKSHHDFLSAYQTTLHHSPQPLEENLATSYHTLLGNHLHHLHPFNLPGHPQHGRTTTLPAVSPLPVPKWSPQPKRWLPMPEPQGSMSIDETTSRATCRKGHLVPRSMRPQPGLLHLNLVACRGFSPGLQYRKRGQVMLLFQAFI